MKQVLYILVASIFLTSCATIINSSQEVITIYTTQPSKISLQHDTINTNHNKVFFKVKRKKEPIKITASTDSCTKTITVRSNNSFAYWSNIVCNYGIGMLVDRKNPKRYSYPSRIYINSTDTINRYYRYRQDNKGALYLHISLPHINAFNLTPEKEGAKINTGFWGLTLGVDYYHSKNQFLNVGMSGVSDFFVPFPAAVDISGEYELMSSRYISVSNNHRFGRLCIGYGLSYARNTWDLRYYDRFSAPPPTREPIKRSHHAFGCIFPTHFQLGKCFNIGVVYRPTFYRPNIIEKFKYEHLISIDFA